MPLGSEMALNDSFSAFEKFYIRLLGAPVNGLRIRARRVLPQITDRYKNIMDAGCGPGVFTFDIAKRFPNAIVTGVDIDEQALSDNRNIASKLGLKNCAFEYQDLTKMTEENRFDLVVTVDNLEHLEDDLDALKRYYKALVKGGEIMIHVPGYERRWLVFGWAVNFDVEGHFRPGYTKDELQKKLETAGFKVEEIYYTYGWIETITNNISYWITGAQMKNKLFYAMVFPFLNSFSYFGRNSRPKKGAGVFARAVKASA